MPGPISDRPTNVLSAELRTRTTSRPGPQPRSPRAFPLVAVSTCDPGALQQLSLRLYGRAEVRPVRGTIDLKRYVRTRAGCVVVLDCAAPEIDPMDVASALAAVGTPTVVVWGASPAIKEDLAASADSARWVHVGLDTEPGALAELISSLF